MGRYLIDAKLPRWFSLWSSGDYVFVHDINPRWTDTEIWTHAAVHGLTIVTKELIFLLRSHREHWLVRRLLPRVIGQRPSERYLQASLKRQDGARGMRAGGVN
jgi:hypothetical protein